MNRKFLKNLRLFALIAISATLFSCGEKEDSKDTLSIAAIDETPAGNISLISPDDEGVYVLCEGLMGQFNAAMDFYSTKTKSLEKDAFNSINAMGMGGTANDMLKVDNYIFVAVTDDAMVRVLNANNMTVYKRFPMVNEKGVNRQPRHLVYYKGNVYVSCFDGNVVKINVNKMAITSVVNTNGRNPEGITINNGKIFVANSGGLSYPNYDKTVSVIDCSSFSVDKVIEVSDNPTQVHSYKDYVYTLSMGDYSKLPILTKISVSSKKIVDTMSIAATDMKIYGDYMYYFYNDYNTGMVSLNKMNLNTKKQEDFAQVPSDMHAPYKISIVDDIVYITDANDYKTSGKVYVFDLNGTLLYQFKSSVNPNIVIKKEKFTIA